MKSDISGSLRRILFRVPYGAPEETYPRSRTCRALHEAKEKLLMLYLETVRNSDYLTFDEGLLKLLADRGE